MAVAGQADSQQSEAIERILAEAGLEGEALSETMAKLKEALTSSKPRLVQVEVTADQGATGVTVRVQPRIAKATIVGPDGQSREIKLLDAGGGAQRVIVRPPLGQVRQLRPRALALNRKRLWGRIEKALEAAGMIEEQIDTVHRALENALAGEPDPTGESESAEGAQRYVLGLSCGKPSEELNTALNLEGKGALVQSVFEDMPAKQSGVREGDVVIKANGREVLRPEDLVAVVQEAGESDGDVVLTVIRDGETMEIAVTPQERREIEIEIGDTEGLRIFDNLPGPEGLSEIGPGIIRFRGPPAPQKEFDTLKKRLETLEQQVSELQKKAESE